MPFNDLAKMLRDNTLIKSENSSLSIFAEEPVSLDIFMRDKKYLGNPPLSLIQYNAVRAIERIYFPDMYPLLAAEFGPKKNQTTVGPAGAFSQDVEDNYWAAKIPMINKATLQWGKGAGKDHTCRIISMRIAYLLLCLHSPQSYYGVPEQDSIHLLNVATSSKQAQSAFFEPLSKAVRLGWFKDRADPHVSTVTYDKNIECISGHSDAETQEGLNLLLGIADEIDGFKSKQELEKTQRTKSNRDPSRSAESILELLESSAITRFPEVYKNVRISYPRYLGSMIQLLTEEAKQDIRENGKKSKHYVSGPLATWDVNPLRKKENFDEMYKKDAASARGKYECKPARSTNPYFRNHPAVDACLVKSEVPEITIDYVRSGEAWEAEYLFHPSLVPIQGARYAMHADLAVRGDRAGISMAHVVKNVEFENIVIGEDGEELPFLESRPYVKVDFVSCFESNITCEPPREIQIRWARQLCFELIKRGFNIRQFTFDNFQSIDSQQSLNAKGIPSKRVSTDVDSVIWRTLQDMMYESRCIIPFSDLLREELLSLTRLPNGKIDHLLGGSKDLADSLACAVTGALELGGSEGEEPERAYYEPARFVVGPMLRAPFSGPRDLGLPIGMEQYLPTPGF